MIKFENVTKIFNQGTVDETILFDNFNFEVKKGEFVSVIGSNGSGKTTMLNLLCGSSPMDKGNLIVNNIDITKMKEYRRAKVIGRVFQDPAKGSCANLTILENMALADNKTGSFGLSTCVNKRKTDYYKSLLETCNMGLENRMNVPVGSLSGGQRQALALVLANMTDIDLLILDEHTAALDPKSSKTVMDITQKVIETKGITTLMVTHNLRFAVDYGNRLVMMHEGKIVLDLNEKEKQNISIDNILSKFNQISIECGN
ncbi:MAG: ATP-binding cassette domain-containing protein [Oscillospiraceae bacterium]|nr:ATP-binding cassette domain-containing protein [Oscillospiraceae bacterium]